METIKITTSQNIDLEYELGSVGDRIVAYIIDWLIIAAYAIIAIASLFGFADPGSSDSKMIILFLLFIPIFFYDLVFEISLNGQSPGKKAMGLKVISISGEQPSFGQYLIRWLFRLIDFSLFSGLVATITVAVSEKKQRVGDLVAGTTVVKTRARAQFSDTLYTPVNNPLYEITYPEVINLKDSDIELIKEVLRNVDRTGNTMLAVQAQQRIEQVLGIMSRQSEPKIFLHVILADYNHVTSSL